LTGADRERLGRHLLRLRPAEPHDAVMVQHLCDALDFTATACFGAFARNELVATGLGLDPVPGGAGIAVTVLPTWRKRRLSSLLSGQVLDAATPEGALPAQLLLALTGVLTRLGARMVPLDQSGPNWICTSDLLSATA